MASNAGKKGGGRTTAKGTRPPVKATGKGGGKAAIPEKGAPAPTVNRQMRRTGQVPEMPEPDTSRMRLILIAAGVVTALLVILCMVLFKVSGTWIGLLGLAAGLGIGLAVATGKTWFADKGRWSAIAIAAVGVVATAIGAAGVVDMHWPFAALIGCGLGAVIAEMAVQQMTPPQSPPASAQALLRRNGAQLLPAPSTGDTVWATPDGRIRVIVGATVPEGIAGDDVLRDRNVRRNRQRGDLVARRMAAVGVEAGIMIVVDSGITTIRDGADTICSPAGLSKALTR